MTLSIIVVINMRKISILTLILQHSVKAIPKSEQVDKKVLEYSTKLNKKTSTKQSTQFALNMEKMSPNKPAHSGISHP